MTTFTFTSPDGKNYDVDGPEGATKEQAFGVLQKRLGPAASAPAEEKPEITLPGHPIGEAIGATATGMVAKPISDIAGLGAIPLHAAGLIKTDPSEVKEKVQRGMTYEPQTPAGKALTEYNPMALFGKLMGAGSEKAKGLVAPPGTAADSLRGMAGNALGEAIQQAPGFLGAKAGKAVEAGLPKRQAALDVSKGENAMKDAVRDTAQDKGYITPPEGGIKSAVGGVGGPARNNKIISGLNEETATRRLGGAVGVPEGGSLNKAAFEGLKESAGEGYNAMKQAAGPTLKMTDEFKGAIDSTLAEIDKKLAYNREQYKSLVPVQRLYRSYLKKFEPIEVPAGKIVDERGSPLIPASTKKPSLLIPTDLALESISDLRAQAKDHFMKRDSDLGYAKLGLANQMENLFESSLAQKGNPALLDQFRAARKRFAQIYLLERITNDATGKVDLSKLASLSETKAYKNVLDGEFRDAADFAKTYRKAAQKGTGEVPPRLTVFDGMFALSSIAAGHPWAAAAELGGRLGVPALASRGMLQNKTPSYQATPGNANLLRLLGAGASQGQPPPQ